MSPQNGRHAPDTEEQERIDRYLAWRRAQKRDRRPSWRVVALASVAVAAFALAGNLVLAWLMRAPTLDAPPRALDSLSSDATTDATRPRSQARPAPPRSVEQSPAVTPPPAVTPRPPRVASKAPPALPPRSHASAPPRPTEPPAYDASPVTRSAPASGATGAPEARDEPSGAAGPVTAAVAPEPAGPAEAPPPPAPADTTPVTPPPPPITADPPVTPPPAIPTPDPVVTSPPPATARLACGPGILRTPTTADGRTRGQAVADCVGGWVKGEAQEFRDGVKRGIGDFRAGFDRFRRGLSDLGSKIRGAD
jgi:hypothetical protein